MSYLLLETKPGGLLMDGRIVTSDTFATNPNDIEIELRRCPEGNVRYLLKVIRIARHEELRQTKLVVKDAQ